MIAHDSGSLSALPLAVAADELLPGPGRERVGQAYILVLLYLRACERTPAALSFGGVKGVIEILPEVCFRYYSHNLQPLRERHNRHVCKATTTKRIHDIFLWYNSVGWSHNVSEGKIRWAENGCYGVELE